MRIVISNSYFKLSIIMYNSFVVYILCTTESFRNYTSERNIKQISDENHVKYIKMQETEIKEDLSTWEYFYLLDKGFQDLNTFFNNQKEVINKIKDILNRPRMFNNWKNYDEQFEFENLYEEFFGLTIIIHEKIINSHIKLLGIFNNNLNAVLNNIIIITKVKNILIKDIRVKRSDLSISVCLKETLKKTTDIYSEIYSAYCFFREKRTKISRYVSKLRHTFNKTIQYIKKMTKEIKTEEFRFIRVKLLRLFQMFDKKHHGSINKVCKLIQKMLAASLMNLFVINDKACNFAHPNTEITTNNE